MEKDRLSRLSFLHLLSGSLLYSVTYKKSELNSGANLRQPQNLSFYSNSICHHAYPQTSSPASCRQNQTGKTTRLKEWQAVSARQQFANEYTVAARLGEPAFTEDQAEMVAALFGK